MFHIDDLYSMDDQKLQEVAESMGMKNASSSSREDLLNHILDNQAIDTAKDIMSKESSKKKPVEKKPRAKRTPAKKGADNPANPEAPATPEAGYPDTAPAEPPGGCQEARPQNERGRAADASARRHDRS